MRRFLLWAVALTLCGATPSRAQEAPAPTDEAAAVRKVVETYLYAEEVSEKRDSLLAEAHIVFADDQGRMTRAVPVSKLKARKHETRGRILRSPQKVVAVDVVGDAASVKVSTEFPEESGGPRRPPHFQYLWLLKVKGGWKIAGILMPGVAPQ